MRSVSKHEATLTNTHSNSVPTAPGNCRRAARGTRWRHPATSKLWLRRQLAIHGRLLIGGHTITSHKGGGPATQPAIWSVCRSGAPGYHKTRSTLRQVDLGRRAAWVLLVVLPRLRQLPNSAEQPRSGSTTQQRIRATALRRLPQQRSSATAQRRNSAAVQQRSRAAAHPRIDGGWDGPYGAGDRCDCAPTSRWS